MQQAENSDMLSIVNMHKKHKRSDLPENCPKSCFSLITAQLGLRLGLEFLGLVLVVLVYGIMTANRL